LPSNEQVAAGMLLQKLPSYGGTMEAQVGETGSPLAGDVQAQDLDTWDRACQLGATLKQDELLAESPETLLRRLFWEELQNAGLRVFEPMTPHFQCSCSRAKVAGMLQSLGQAEVESIIAERGDVEIHCDFCGQRYVFDPVVPRSCSRYPWQRAQAKARSSSTEHPSTPASSGMKGKDHGYVKGSGYARNHIPALAGQ
jgi:molecular chaperone Hsp33